MTIAVTPRTLSDLIPVPSTIVQRRVRTVALVTGFALLTAALAQWQLTLGFTPVPITGQTLGVLLAGATLGSWKGAASQALYWVMGLVGLPFYADGAGGWSEGTGATLGYLVGFIVAAGLVGLLAERHHDRSFVSSVPAMLAGTAIIYTFGAGWLAHDLGVPVAVSNPDVLGGETAMSLGVNPFLIGDALKLLVAGAVTPLAWRIAGRGGASD